MSIAVGFDVDGTLTAAAEAFRPMMSSLIDSGHTVHVITGAHWSEKGSCFASPKWRRRQLADLGIRLGTHYTTLDIARGHTLVELGKAKAKLARKYRLVMMFENDTVYADQIGKVCQVVLMDAHPVTKKAMWDAARYEPQQGLWDGEEWR